jgi:hypothetical protein
LHWLIRRGILKYQAKPKVQVIVNLTIVVLIKIKDLELTLAQIEVVVILVVVGVVEEATIKIGVILIAEEVTKVVVVATTIMTINPLQHNNVVGEVDGLMKGLVGTDNFEWKVKVNN